MTLQRIVMVVSLVCVSLGAQAQEPFNLSAPVRDLSTMFADLYGPEGLVVDSLATLPGAQPHNAHFISDFQSNFSQFTTAVVNQLVALPLPSPASGFTFEFDPTLGVFQRSTQSFGPILTERAETIGEGRIAFGSTFQRFGFDTIEGLDLGQIPAVFQHDDAELLGGREDVVTTLNRIDITVSQFTSFLTLGVTDSLDVSLAVPVVASDLSVVSEATIQRLGTTDPFTHYYILSDGSNGAQRTFTAAGRASGLGDITVRLKQSLGRSAGRTFAAGLDMRMPTGDAKNLLGSGAPGLKPFAVWSVAMGSVSPHLNVGYQWNGSSILGGNPATGVSADLPDELTYAAGADVSVSSRLTVAFDLLGRLVIDSSRVVPQDFFGLDGSSVFPDIGFTRDSFNTLRGAVGAKASLAEGLLFDMNLLFALDNKGLVDRATPLVGIEYAF
jgi:hypothetical protein